MVRKLMDRILHVCLCHYRVCLGFGTNSTQVYHRMHPVSPVVRRYTIASYVLFNVVWKGCSNVFLVLLQTFYKGLSILNQKNSTLDSVSLVQGQNIVLTDSVCITGCPRCVDACTPLLLLLLFPLLLLVVSSSCSDTGYQWAPLHVLQGESPSGSFFEIDGLTLIRLDQIR